MIEDGKSERLGGIDLIEAAEVASLLNLRDLSNRRRQLAATTSFCGLRDG
jgi:hypothetical protein